MDDLGVWNGIIDVIQAFSDCTDIETPDLSDDSRKNAEGWVEPANKIMLMVDDDPQAASKLVKDAVEHMHREALTYSNVSSVVNVARMVLKRRQNGTAKAAQLWQTEIEPFLRGDLRYGELGDLSRQLADAIGKEQARKMGRGEARSRYRQVATDILGGVS